MKKEKRSRKNPVAKAVVTLQALQSKVVPAKKGKYSKHKRDKFRLSFID